MENKTITKKTGLVEYDIIQLIKYKKLPEEEQNKFTPNQLSMISDYHFWSVWWQTKINPELYWEFMWLYVDDINFYHSHHMTDIKNIKKEIKKQFVLHLKNINHFKKVYKTNLSGYVGKLIYTYITYLFWYDIVKLNYMVHCKLPYQIRTNTL